MVGAITAMRGTDRANKAFLKHAHSDICIKQ